MAEAKLSKTLLDKLTDFLVNNISEKAMDGITYAMCFKDDKDMVEKGKIIKEEAIKSGFNQDEVFRVYEVSNGYIFDMDLKVAKFLTAEISKIVAKETQGKTPQGDLIGNNPEKRRSEDMMGLAKFCKSQYEKGILNFEVALFSRNSVPRIVVQGTDKKGKPVTVTYNAYAIRHWDIEEINQKVLMPKYGIRINRIKPCEIISSKTGVRFEIQLARAM